MNSRMAMATLIPLLAILTIVLFAGGLGVLFMVLSSTSLGEGGVIILGVALVVGVPTAAAIIQRKIES